MREKKSLNVSKNSDNIKLVDLWVRVVEWRVGKLSLFVLQIALLFKSRRGNLFFKLRILRHVAVKLSSTCYMHLHHAAVSPRQWVQWKKARKSKLCQTEWIVCTTAQSTSIWQTLSLDSKRCQFETWTRRRKALVSKRPDAVRSLHKTSANATSIQSSLI